MTGSIYVHLILGAGLYCLGQHAYHWIKNEDIVANTVGSANEEASIREGTSSLGDDSRAEKTPYHGNDTVHGLDSHTGPDHDAAYVLSASYAHSRLQNQDWVAKTDGKLPVYKAPHFSNMPVPGQAHLIFTRLLHLWSKAAEASQAEWSVIGGTLLGYLRHGDFVPHDHDIDLFLNVDHKEKVVQALRSVLPCDVAVVTYDGAWHGLKLLTMSGNKPSCCVPMHERKLPCTFLDAWDYNETTGLDLWEGIRFPPDKLNPFRDRREVIYGRTKAYLPYNSIGTLTADLCRDVKTDCGIFKFTPRPSETRLSGKMMTDGWCANWKGFEYSQHGCTQADEEL